ncbi:MAG: hypothetical protein ACREO5_02925 [Candidatus Binatia bacterium]
MLIVVVVAVIVKKAAFAGDTMKFGISGSMTTGASAGALHADNSHGFTPTGVYDAFVYDSNGSLVKSMTGRVNSAGIPQWRWTRADCEGRFVLCPEGAYSVLAVDESSGRVTRASFGISRVDSQ